MALRRCAARSRMHRLVYRACRNAGRARCRAESSPRKQIGRIHRGDRWANGYAERPRLRPHALKGIVRRSSLTKQHTREGEVYVTSSFGIATEEGHEICNNGTGQEYRAGFKRGHPRFRQARRRSPRLLLLRRNSFGGMARKPAGRLALDDERSRGGFLRGIVVRSSQKSHRSRLDRREIHDERDRSCARAFTALDEAGSGKYPLSVGSITWRSAIRSSRCRVDHRDMELSSDADIVAVSRSDCRG